MITKIYYSEDRRSGHLTKWGLARETRTLLHLQCGSRLIQVRKRTGKEVGDNDPYHFVYYYEATPELEARYVLQCRRRYAGECLIAASSQLGDLTLEQCDQIIALVKILLKAPA